MEEGDEVGIGIRKKKGRFPSPGLWGRGGSPGVICAKTAFEGGRPGP